MKADLRLRWACYFFVLADGEEMELMMAHKAASGFIWYELMTDDLGKAVRFYGDVVGWDTRDSGMPGMAYMLFGKDGRDVGGMMAWSSLGMNKPTAWKGHIFTEDVDTEAAAVVADGGKLYRPTQEVPGVGRFAVVADPQGAEYLLFQPKGNETPQQLAPNEPGGVGWRELGTSDWEKAWDFYSKHYGWTAGMAVDMGPAGTYQTFTLNGDNGGGMMTTPPEFASKMPGPAWLFYFTVDDIQSAAQRIKESGGAVTHGPAQVPGGAWVVQGTDDQGGAFALTAGR